MLRWSRHTICRRRRTTDDVSIRNILIVYRKELTEALRDSRTLISSILIPLLLFPVLTFGIGYAFVELLIGEANRLPSRIMMVGGEDSPDVVARLKSSEESARRGKLARITST